MQSREYAKLTTTFPLSATRRQPLGAVRSIAITGGKGGVGKSNIAANLAVALAELGKKTLLLDADLGLANVDVILGLQPRFNLADLVAGRCTLEEVIIEGPAGLLVIPAASGRRHMADLGRAEHAGLVDVISELERDIEILIIDTAAGLSDSVLTFCQAAQDTVVVVCDEPASITDAYALIKVLSRERGVDRIQVVANMVRDPQEGRMLYDKLVRVCEKFLADVSLNYLGAVPQDDWLRLSVQRQQPVVKAYPAAPASMAIKEMAARTARWQPPTEARGGIEFFLERIIHRGVTA